jgi:aspartate kinase
MQFVVNEKDYELAVAALHKDLVEPLDHGSAIALAS